MAQSLNTSVELTCAATSFAGLAKYGKVMLGDKAFEFYNDRNVEDFIQIPWGEVERVAASVLPGRRIARFAIFTTAGATPFSFSTRDNKAVLRVVRDHVGEGKLVRSASLAQVMAAGVKSLLHR